jgi:hypothetical protein
MDRGIVKGKSATYSVIPVFLTSPIGKGINSPGEPGYYSGS